MLNAGSSAQQQETRDFSVKNTSSDYEKPSPSRRALMDSDDKPLLILGGRSVVTPYLLRRLAEQSRRSQVVSRRPLEFPPSLTGTYEPILADVAQRDWQPAPKSTIISLLPLWVMADNVEMFATADVLIALGSTSVFSKQDSPDPKEKEIARKLAEAEARLRAYCAENNILLTILRPTLIYDGKSDKNIARVARLAKKMKFTPVAGKADGLRQPIHADDVADAIMRALHTEEAMDHAFNIAGGEILTFRQMIQKTYEAHGLRPHLLSLPTALLESAFKAAGKLGIIRSRSEGYAMFRRMNDNLVFDIDEGVTVLKYNQRPFSPQEKDPDPHPKKRAPELDAPCSFPLD